MSTECFKICLFAAIYCCERIEWRRFQSQIAKSRHLIEFCALVGASGSFGSPYNLMALLVRRAAFYD